MQLKQWSLPAGLGSTNTVHRTLGVVHAQDKPTWMDEEHCLLPWQPDLITWVIKAGVSALKTYTTDTYLHDVKDRRPGGSGEPFNLCFTRRWHASPFICGAAKILTDACTIRGQSEEIKCHNISRYGAIPFQEFMCRIFSFLSLVVSSGIIFIPKKKKIFKYQTTFTHQINHRVGLTGASRNCRAPQKPK